MVSSMTIKDVINPSCINLHMKGKDKKHMNGLIQNAVNINDD